ncbi:VOC family protein [Croceicoccus naphthovorans]|uniref:Glyoxalase n=1 Tax=Croceicoccus naphthovorans TaxID=1348774 RepID=A0A0G3XG93_9SPHN|nr:VOC family protein [Croceicoccus naphthovorans]AKM10222.1 glyoxalase [Croceicoccus naphthovorans]MBB3990521.1 catechol 2,3-dioxygenase-like lactoylglutathione lyase family enzyme [Croceicoccus naphthovorans]
MFSHVHLGSNDVERARKFYDALMASIGGSPGVKDTGRNRYFYHHKGAMLIVGEPLDGQPATVGNGVTIGFGVDSVEQGNAWHEAGIANGGTSVEDPPGPRDRGERGQIYLGYLRDPDGNKLCALKFLDT